MAWRGRNGDLSAAKAGISVIRDVEWRDVSAVVNIVVVGLCGLTHLWKLFSESRLEMLLDVANIVAWSKTNKAGREWFRRTSRRGKRRRTGQRRARLRGARAYGFYLSEEW